MKKKDEVRGIRDKGKGNISVYVPEGWGLTIDYFQDDEADGSFLKGWVLCSPSERYEGKTVKEFMSTLDSIRAKKGLRLYSKKKKDILVIYTDELFEVSCFLYYEVQMVFKYYIQVANFFEIRGCWDEDLVTAQEISNWADALIHQLFIPDDYWYITKSQIFRKRIAKACKTTNCVLAKEIYPDTYFVYEFVRKALFGGICYCPRPMELIERALLEIDINSAYIYCFFLEHCITKSVFLDKEKWRNYLNKEGALSVGEYKITYKAHSDLVHSYKDKDEINAKIGEIATSNFIFTNIDLQIFMDNCEIYSIECVNLLGYESGFLPNEILKAVGNAYIGKATAKKGTSDRQIKKVITNSIYGNTIRKVLNRLEYLKERESTDLNVLWGIFITSYCKYLLVSLGSQLEGWVYSDTDSIFCYDTPENREKIAKFNEVTRDVLRENCSKLGIDFEPLKELGKFEIEYEITKFKAWKHKQYAFTTKEGKVIVKAAGCNRDSINRDDSIYSQDKIPCGEKVLKKMLITEPRQSGVYYSESCPYILKMGGYTEEDDQIMKAMALLIRDIDKIDFVEEAVDE